MESILKFIAAPSVYLQYFPLKKKLKVANSIKDFEDSLNRLLTFVFVMKTFVNISVYMLFFISNDFFN